MNNEFAYDSPIIASNIVFQTTCEHHLVPIKGIAVIAYAPKDKLIGLSKINELLYFFAARPQLQERLTLQIVKSLSHILQTEDVAVLIKASHDCMNINGNSNDTTTHITSKFGGVFVKQVGFQTNLMQLFNGTQYYP
jgi:GTP cyclohydrolase I